MPCARQNNRLIFLMTVIAVLQFYPESQAQKSSVYKGLTIPADPVLPSVEIHPSLYFYSQDVPVLIQRQGKDFYTQLLDEIENDVNFYVNSEASRQNSAHRPRMTKTLAFRWIIQGDSTALEQSINALLLAFQDVPPVSDLPYDEIRRATWLQNYCASYNLVY